MSFYNLLNLICLVYCLGDEHGGVTASHSTPFSSASAKIVIQEIMECSTEMDTMRNDLDMMRKRMDLIEQKYKNILDIMGRIQD